MLNYTESFHPGRRATDPDRWCACGENLNGDHPETAICRECRLAASPKKTCDTCGVIYQAFNAHRCEICTHANYVWRRYASGQTLASGVVASAKRKGTLQPARNFQCVDCGEAATEYDHRDYNEPLKVEPVCRGCNRRRGNAAMKNWSFDEFWAWFERVRDEHRRTNRGYVGDVQYEHFHPFRRQRGEVIPIEHP